jgi:hypothetical protein
MNAPVTHRRVAATAAALALAVGPLATTLATTLVAPAAQAATPSRTADTAVDTTYLQDTLGLPADTVVETVTYDRFQWLLQQPGRFAFLVGSTADANFKANAVAADQAARQAGVKRIYWFDPNLTGYTGDRNLDIRKPEGINLAAGSQTLFGNTWKNLLGQYLGNGIKATPNATQTSVTISADDTVVNDAVDPLWDYRTDATDAPVSSAADVFFLYDKDHTASGAADKVLDWTNLSDAATPADATAAVAATITGAGTGAVTELGQFQWWKGAANKKHDLSYPDDARYGGDIITDADNADGWRVKQVTYPELIHLLEVRDSPDKDFVLLFGGTWCHNTRAVLKDVNREAQENGVATVYNFDLVLDGGTTNGTNGGANPIHVRDNANSGTTTNFRPSYVYGDLVRTYLKNLITEYDPNTGTRVSYYPGGNLASFPDVVRKLQVPFLVDYQRGSAATPSATSVKRQWIQQNTDPSTGLPTFREYMSEWWFTHPSARLGLNPTYTNPNSPGYPTDLAIPASPAAAQAAPDSAFLDAADAARTDAERSQIAQIRRASVSSALAGRDFGQEAVAKLGTFFGGLPGAVVSRQTVTAPTVRYGTAPKVVVAIANDYGRVPAGNATLTVGGRSYTVKVAQNAATFVLPKLVPGTYPYTVAYAGDDQVVAFTRTGALTVAKGTVLTTAGKVAKAPTSKKAGSYQVTVATAAGLAGASGKVTVTLAKGATKKKVTGTLTAGRATVGLPKLGRGTWTVKLAYAGDARYAPATGSGGAVKVKK